VGNSGLTLVLRKFFPEFRRTRLNRIRKTAGYERVNKAKTRR
jgi:hypothetical protein